MRALVALLLASVALAGCSYDEDPQPRFTPSCPYWFPSPSEPKWSSPQGAMRHDADNPHNPDVRDPNDWTKWVPTTGDVNATPQYNASGVPIPDFDVRIYKDGTLGFVELTFTNITLVDSLLVFEAYRASQDEPAVTPSGEDPIEPTGPRLQFTTARQGGTVDSEVRFGPHVGHDNYLTGLEARVYLDLQPSKTTVDPSRVRIDARYYGNQDGDPSTDSVALFDEISAKFWYMHNDCIS